MTSQRGFTLIELMVTVTVAAILISVAIPFFRDVIISSRLNTVSLEIADALALARSESIKRNRTITFCRTDSADSYQCNSGTEWAHWLIREGASGTDEDGVIKYGSFDGMSSITVKTPDISNGQLNFSSDGLIRSAGLLINNIQFIICANNITQNSTPTVNIGAAGQISIVKSDGACE